MQTDRSAPPVRDYFILRHVNAAHKVHDVCDAHAVPHSEARLYSYIHVKSLERGEEIHDTPLDESVEMEALKALLGTDEWRDAPSRDSGDRVTRGVSDAFVGPSDDLKRTDHAICQDHNLEFRQQSELHDRLRFHTDLESRAAKLRFYRSKIRPAVWGR